MKISWNNALKRNMETVQHGDVVFLQFPSFCAIPDIVHGFSTRLGGVSQGIYSSMNLGMTRGDDPAAVMENFRRIAEAIGFSVESIVSSDQTHTTNVRKITAEDRGNGIMRPKSFFDTDGMITNVPGVTLATFYADCVPLYFVDPVHHAIGLSHSGWRGTAGKIGRKTVEAMTEAYGSVPAEMYAAIGPSICQDCYEVSEDVAQAFRSAFPGHSDLLKDHGSGKYLLDLWQANRHVLIEAGIPDAQIETAGLCTCCNPEMLFSHRASHGRRGNLAAFLSLRLPVARSRSAELHP